MLLLGFCGNISLVVRGLPNRLETEAKIVRNIITALISVIRNYETIEQHCAVKVKEDNKFPIS